MGLQNFLLILLHIKINLLKKMLPVVLAGNNYLRDIVIFCRDIKIYW